MILEFAELQLIRRVRCKGCGASRGWVLLDAKVLVVLITCTLADGAAHPAILFCAAARSSCWLAIARGRGLRLARSCKILGITWVGRGVVYKREGRIANLW